MKNNKTNQKAISNKKVTLKTYNNANKEQILSMINNTEHLSIISETLNEITIVSTHEAKPFKELFPTIKRINSRKRNSIYKKANLFKKNNNANDFEIVNLSGVLVKK